MKLLIKETLEIYINRVYNAKQQNIYNINNLVIHGDVLDLTGRFGEDMQRVGELFSVINGQNKLNANNVIEADFAPRAYAVAA